MSKRPAKVFKCSVTFLTSLTNTNTVHSKPQCLSILLAKLRRVTKTIPCDSKDLEQGDLLSEDNETEELNSRSRKQSVCIVI